MSGIYITGMEMPKNCRECILEQPFANYSCAITGKSYSWGLSGRPSDCPLFHVPDHGRLIDGDFAEADLVHDYAYAAAKMVRGYPTIIPADKGGETDG